MIQFGNPQALWLYAVLVLLVALGISFQLRRRRRLQEFIERPAWNTIHRGPSVNLSVLRWILFVLAAVFAIFACAQPRWGHQWREVKRRGVDIMVLLDTSNSMRAADLKPNRLQRAKWGIESLTHTLKGDRIGLVAFAGDAFLQCPLTHDYPAFMMHLNDIEPGIIPRGGTNLGRAFEVAIQGFDGAESDGERVIMLITDGEDHQDGLESQLQLLKQRNIRVFIVGVGTPEGELISIQNADGTSTYLKNRSGDVVKTRLNETGLRNIANRTSGLYLRSTPADFGLVRLHEEGIRVLKKAEHANARVKQHNEQYQWFLALALLFLFLESFSVIPAFLKRNGGAT